MVRILSTVPRLFFAVLVAVSCIPPHQGATEAADDARRTELLRNAPEYDLAPDVPLRETAAWLDGDAALALWRRVHPALLVTLDRGGSVLTALPARIISMTADAAEALIAQREAIRRARRDTLWMQAGSGAAGMNYLEGSNLGVPKWTGEFPSISSPAAGEAEPGPSDPGHFSFQVGR